MSACILVVDDDPVARRLLENMVRRFGYEAIGAEGGDEAGRVVTATGGPRLGWPAVSTALIGRWTSAAQAHFDGDLRT